MFLTNFKQKIEIKSDYIRINMNNRLFMNNKKL